MVSRININNPTNRYPTIKSIRDNFVAAAGDINALQISSDIIQQKIDNLPEIVMDYFDGQTDNQKLQAAIDYSATIGGGIITTKKKTLTLSKIKVTNSFTILDFNLATILAVLSNNDTPDNQSCIQLEGTLANTSHNLNTVNVNDNFITFQNTTDISNYVVNDYIIISNNERNYSWNYGKQAETSAFYPTYYGSWIGGKEIHRIKEIDTNLGRLYLDNVADYLHLSASAKVTKISNPLFGCEVRNIGNIYQVDPGVSYTGNIEAINAPHLVAAYYCVNPKLINIHSKGWQLSLTKVSCCYGAFFAFVEGENPFRPLVGGHGYVTRSDYSFDIDLHYNKGTKVRHVIDFVQCRDMRSSNNTSYFSANTPYLTHGSNNIRWTSVDDASFANPKDYLQAFTVGNPVFAGDKDIKIIRPKVRGGTYGVFIFNSTNVTVIDPDIEVSTCPITALMGSKNIKVLTGKIAASSKSVGDSQHLIRVAMHNIFDETSTFGLECSDVTINGVEFDIKNLEYNSNNSYRKFCAAYIDAQGTINISDNNKIVNHDTADLTNLNANFVGFITNNRNANQSVQGNPQPTNIIIENNKCYVPCNRLYVQLRVPITMNIFKNNLSLLDTNSLARLIVSNKSIVKDNYSVNSIFFATDNPQIESALQNGAIIMDNQPPSPWDGRQNIKIVGSNIDTNSRQLTFGSILNGTYNLLTRFIFRLTSNDELGSNSGSDLELVTRKDDGSLLDTVFKVTRATGTITIKGTWQAPLILNGNRIWFDATNKLRTKNSDPTSDTDGTVIGTQT